MSEAETDILAALKTAVDAYRYRLNRPSPPLFVPAWFMTYAIIEHGSEEAAAAWIDAEARKYGFDGYTVSSL